MNRKWFWQLLNFWILFFALATSLQKNQPSKCLAFCCTISLPSTTPFTRQGRLGTVRSGRRTSTIGSSSRPSFSRKYFRVNLKAQVNRWIPLILKRSSHIWSLLSSRLICIINEEGVVSKELHLHETSHPTSLAISSTQRCRIVQLKAMLPPRHRRIHSQFVTMHKPEHKALLTLLHQWHICLFTAKKLTLLSCLCLWSFNLVWAKR